jgi:hypothetical protein
VDGPKDTVETAAWDDRELMLRIYYQVVETNGTVRLHDREIYGDNHLGMIGLRQTANENIAFRERAKTLARVGGVLAGAIFSILTTILILILEHVL